MCMCACVCTYVCVSLTARGLAQSPHSGSACVLCSLPRKLVKVVLVVWSRDIDHATQGALFECCLGGVV